jgi:hypothetical protein
MNLVKNVHITMKSNSDITSQKLMKQRMDALIKAGDELKDSLEIIVRQESQRPMTEQRITEEIRVWDAAKKAIRP